MKSATRTAAGQARADRRVFYSFGEAVPELSDACDAQECGSCWRSSCGCACHEVAR